MPRFSDELAKKLGEIDKREDELKELWQEVDSVISDLENALERRGLSYEPIVSPEKRIRGVKVPAFAEKRMSFEVELQNPEIAAVTTRLPDERSEPTTSSIRWGSRIRGQPRRALLEEKVKDFVDELIAAVKREQGLSE